MSAVSILKIEGGIQINLKVINSILDKAGDHPLAIYSISGKKRTGKSFLFGYFLKYLKSENKTGDWMKLMKNEEANFNWRGGAEDDKTLPMGQSSNFKLEVLNSRRSQPLDVQFTHDTIMKSFRNVGAYLMPDPDKGLRRFDKVNEMGDEFVEHVKNFVELILSKDHIVTKTVGGQEVNGFEMKTYVGIWASLFLDGVLPKIENLYQTTANAQYQMAKSTALDYFHVEIKKVIDGAPNGISLDSLLLKKVEIIADAQIVYLSRSKLSGDDMNGKFVKEFEEDTQKEFQIYKMANHSNLERNEKEKEFKKQMKDLNTQISTGEKAMMDLAERNSAEQSTLRQHIENGQANRDDLKKMIERQEEDKKISRQQILDHQVSMEAMRRERDEAEVRYREKLNTNYSSSGSDGCKIL